MTKKLVLLLIVALVLLSAAGITMAAQGDLERELRLRSEIEDMILDGDPVSLVADGHEFLGIYTEADDPKAGVVIMHGRGFHPDWQDVVAPLRVGLVEHGWTTLSIQMPVLEKDAKYYDYVPLFDAAAIRIDSAIDYLHEQGLDKVILIAHSCGVHMAMHWVDLAEEMPIQGFVGIGMGATDYQQYMAKPLPLEKLKVPVLDLYGENDYPAVIRMAPERLEAMNRAANPKSSQMMLSDANHYITGKDKKLLEAVSDWLDTLGF